MWVTVREAKVNLIYLPALVKLTSNCPPPKSNWHFCWNSKWWLIFFQGTPLNFLSPVRSNPFFNLLVTLWSVSVLKSGSSRVAVRLRSGAPAPFRHTDSSKADKCQQRGRKTRHSGVQWTGASLWAPLRGRRTRSISESPAREGLLICESVKGLCGWESVCEF